MTSDSRTFAEGSGSGAVSEAARLDEGETVGITDSTLPIVC
jgi:hypothetical protein